MKAMNNNELDDLCQSLLPYLGSRLDRIHFDEKVLQLRWASADRSAIWLTVSMKPGQPFAFVSRERISLVKSLKKPLALFLRTHFSNATLVSCSRQREWGRVVVLEMTLDGDDLGQDGLIEISLVPGALNIRAQMDSKVVHAFKPKPIKKQESLSESEQEFEVRPADFFLQAWQKRQNSYQKGVPRDRKKDLERKQKALLKMQEKIDQQKQNTWSQVGHFLKEQTRLDDLPEEYQDFVDIKQSVLWNMENCFQQAKKKQGKVAGTLSRIEELKKEIRDLESGKETTPPPRAKSLLQQSEAKGRTVALGKMRLFVGRSGSENLKLLRKAKAWYLWLHIRDYPGAFGIIEKAKGEGDLNLEVLQEAARAVIQQSLPKSAQGVFDVLYTECRYVRPIKGAKAGQVTYSHERVITVKV